MKYKSLRNQTFVFKGPSNYLCITIITDAHCGYKTKNILNKQGLVEKGIDVT